MTQSTIGTEVSQARMNTGHALGCHNGLPADRLGTVTLEHEGDLVAGGLASFTLRYTCGTFGLDDLGAVLLAFRSANDQTALQTKDPAAAGYVTAEASSGAALDIRFMERGFVRPWFKALTITTREYMTSGEEILIRIGDRRFGGKGVRLQTFAEERYRFRVLVDPIATGLFQDLPQQPLVSIRPGPVSRWVMTAPTQRRQGDAFSIGLRAEDMWGNPTCPATAYVRFDADATVEGLPAQFDWPADGRGIRIDGLRCNTPGALRLTASAPDGAQLAMSHPLHVVDATQPNHFWSDLHGQSEETIGTGSADEYFRFARDVACVDISGHQANDFQISDSFWIELNGLTRNYHQPGTFLTVPGYEWSGNTGVGGDHNVWYLHEDRPLFRSSSVMAPVTALQSQERHTLDALFDSLQDEQALVAAHVGGRYADVKFAHDRKLEPSVEIHSCWGTFEWILRDALKAGYRVGVVAASDDHKGRPGASHPGASKFGAYGGLTCHLMESLTRDAMFESFRNRHHYATTGARIHVAVKALLDGTTVTMGDIVTTGGDAFTFDAEVTGSAPIERIELRDGLEVLETIRPFATADLGRRIRVVWEGAESRGRSRNSVWDGSATVSGNRIARTRGINFWNPERPLQVEGKTIRWSSFTTGSFSGFDMWLEGEGGEIEIRTPSVTERLRISDIGLGGNVYECGGIDKRLRVFRLPDELTQHTVRISRRLPCTANESRIFIAVTQEDGHRAWTSPVYVLKK